MHLKKHMFKHLRLVYLNVDLREQLFARYSHGSGVISPLRKAVGHNTVDGEPLTPALIHRVIFLSCFNLHSGKHRSLNQYATDTASVGCRY